MRLEELSDPVYYRPYLRRDKTVTYLCLQSLDEIIGDMDKGRYLTEEKFDTEAEARSWFRNSLWAEVVKEAE